jgi:hypothetical protein
MPQVFEQLKQKYQSALNLMQQLQVQVQNINMEGTRLLIRGVAPSLDVKNRVWNQIKLIDASFNDLICDLSVSQQQPDGCAITSNYDCGSLSEWGPKSASLCCQTGRYSFQDQSRLL